MLEVGQTEVGHLGITIVAYENILGFQILVDNSLLVQVLEGEQHIGPVELGLKRAQSLLGLDKVEELSTTAVVQCHGCVVLCAHCKVLLHNKFLTDAGLLIRGSY